MGELIRKDLIYPDLSYQVIGSLFSVHTGLGSGHRESFYQKAIAKEFESRGIEYKKELPAKISYKKEIVGMYYFDFLVENKIVLETKVRDYFSKKDIDQLYSYLKAKNYKLGIIAHFTKSGVKCKRVVNLD